MLLVRTYPVFDALPPLALPPFLLLVGNRTRNGRHYLF